MVGKYTKDELLKLKKKHLLIGDVRWWRHDLVTSLTGVLEVWDFLLGLNLWKIGKVKKLQRKKQKLSRTGLKLIFIFWSSSEDDSDSSNIKSSSVLKDLSTMSSNSNHRWLFQEKMQIIWLRNLMILWKIFKILIFCFLFHIFFLAISFLIRLQTAVIRSHWNYISGNYLSVVFWLLISYSTFYNESAISHLNICLKKIKICNLKMFWKQWFSTNFLSNHILLHIYISNLFKYDKCLLNA